MKEEGVYLLHDGGNLFKIGRTVDLIRRMKEYCTHNQSMKVIGYISGANEIMLHKMFESFKKPGTKEWFFAHPIIQDYFEATMSKQDKTLVQSTNQIKL